MNDVRNVIHTLSLASILTCMAFTGHKVSPAVVGSRTLFRVSASAFLSDR